MKRSESFTNCSLIKTNLAMEKIFLLISLFGFIYVLLFNDNFNYSNMKFLPLCYFVFNTVLFFNIKQNNSFQYQCGIAYIAASSVIFIRYVITPIAMVYSGNYSGIGIDPDKDNLDLAIILMCVELFMVTITLYVAILYYSHKDGKKIKLENLTTNLQSMPLNVTVIVFAVVFFLLVVLLDAHLLLPQDISLSEGDYPSLTSEEQVSGGIYVFANLVKVVLLLIGLSFFKLKYDHKRKGVYIILSFVVSILYMGMSMSTKRWDMLFAGILCLFMLNQLYRKIPKIIFVAIISAMVVSILSISVYKFSWYIHDSSDPMRDIISYLIESFQAYFSGARNVAQAIDMKEVVHSITAATFFNDFLGSIPILSNWIDQTDRINIYFNLYNHLSSPSQIIPMIGIGYCYFPLLSPLLTMLCEWYVIKADYCIQNTNCLEFKFLYCYLALYLAMCMGFNTQIIFSFFVTKFLPLYLLFLVNRKIVLKSRRQRSDGGVPYASSIKHHCTNL
jgi:hypothetical protein